MSIPVLRVDIEVHIDILYEPMYDMNQEVTIVPTNKPRYTVIVDEELLNKIDDFRFENRYPSRSAATLELIRLSMESFKKKQKDKEKISKKGT